jgi:hypothetical protein
LPRQINIVKTTHPSDRVMAPGDLPVAIATVISTNTAGGFDEGASAATTVTFFRPEGSKRSILLYHAPDQDKTRTLKPTEWTPGYQEYPLYYYAPNEDPANNQVFWATKEGDWANPITIIEAGILIPSQVQSSSLLSTSAPTAVPSSPPGSTPTTTPQNAPGNTTITGGNPNNTTTEDRNHSGGGNNVLSSGAIAGVAIGSLVAGVLIAGLAFWLCCGRSRRSRTRDPEPNTVALMPTEKGFTATSVSLSGVPTGTLPQPLEDKAISGDISKISSSIKNHVQSYYHNSRVSPGLVDYDDLYALRPTLPISVGTLTTLMGDPATREIALRFIIAWVLVSRMQPIEGSSQSLLPVELVTCYNSIATGDHGSQSKFTPALLITDSDTLAAHASSVARWRVMTAELMQSRYARNPSSTPDSRNASIKSAFSALDNLLRPYADSRMNNEERKRNLEELLKRASLFAFTLFSQPSAWEFEWQEEQGVMSGELCIFPALVQVTDETGRAVRPPRPFSEAVVRRLDT